MVQYKQIKQQHQDALLFYRMGDFYELFFEDAVQASAALDIVLSKRGKTLGQNIPMCGVPAHSADGYLQTLIRKGYRVAVCEQTEDPAEARKRGSRSVVSRSVIRVLTPGTLTEDELLEARSNNFLAAVAAVRNDLAISWADISVGSLHVMPCTKAALKFQLSRIAPSELLVSDTSGSLIENIAQQTAGAVMPLPPVHFDSASAERNLKELFSVATLDAYGEFSRVELAAIGAIVSYLDLTQKGAIPFLRPPIREGINDTMQIDAATRRNLEIVSDFSGKRKGSLLGTVDRTLTSAGARLLEERVSAPSTDLQTIESRLSSVAYLARRPELRNEIRGHLRQTPDIYRSLSRLALGRGGPRDLSALRTGIEQVSRIRTSLLSHDAIDNPSVLSPADPNSFSDAGEIAHLITALSGHEPLFDALNNALVENPPHLARDGSFIRAGYDSQLDEERRLRDEGRRLIAALQTEFAHKTEIPTLKIKHNKQLGYFVEISAAHADKLLEPPHSTTFTLRHTMTGAKRFSSEKLSETEARIENAASHALDIEIRIFGELVSLVTESAQPINEAAAALAKIDVAAAWAHMAAESSWNRPVVDDGNGFDIQGGRHPVVEHALAHTTSHPFIANDCRLTNSENQPIIRLVTGPNMAGKSTYLRQSALIALLAQSGAFVPAESAHIGLVTQLFSRVGAADELARGRSTFMVEMVETAAILNQASAGAMVILDEIGRGTATHDGLSIAWATLEHLHEINKCRTLFATHYHELTRLTNRLPQLANSTVSVSEWEGEIVFLYKVEDGAAERSYGVQVAKLAGMPETAVVRAHDILERLEADDREGVGNTAELLDELPLFAAVRENRESAASTTANAILELLTATCPDELSPRAALELIYKLKDMSARKP